jgi:transposase InsO family protein
VLEGLARAIDVTVRTIRNLRTQAAVVGPKRPPWRPARFARDDVATVIQVANAWKEQGVSSGERTVFAALGEAIPLRVVRRVMRTLKADHRRRERARMADSRVRVDVLARDVVWCLDATHMGRDGSGEVQGEVLKDVCSTSLLSVSVGRAATTAEVIAALELVAAERGGFPLVLATDNGGAYRSAEFEAFLEEHGIVHLLNEPHTPQHNAVAEHGHGEIKRETGLGKGSKLEALPCERVTIVDPQQDAEKVVAECVQGPVWVVDAGAARTQVPSADRLPKWCRDLQACVLRLNHKRVRGSRSYLTASQLDERLPRGDTLVCRERFMRAARFTIELAVHGEENARARRRARREAIFCTLESFGLVARTRGGVPWPAAKRESQS